MINKQDKKTIKIKDFNRLNIQNMSSEDIIKELIKNGGKCKYLNDKEKCVFIEGEVHPCSELFCPLLRKLTTGV